MSSKLGVYDYDSLGRLIKATYQDGAMATFGYDEMGNRTIVTEIPGSSTPPVPPTVAALPKKTGGDFINHAMMVMLSNGQLIGWGDNTTGALANGIMTATSAPPQAPLFDPNTTRPPFSATIIDWSFVNANLYVVYSNGWVYSAGENSYGQLGQGDTTARPRLVRIEYFVANNLLVTKVWAAGAAYTTNGGGCVYFQASDYSMYSCGANIAGNLGNASTPTSNVSTPAPCTGIGHITNHVVDVQIANVNTSFSTYMLFNDGTLMVAGYNAQGQLGNNATTNVTGAFVSAQVTGGTNIINIKSVTANGGYNGTIPGGNAMVLDSSGNLWTSGYNGHGELGLGSTTNAKIFTQISTLNHVIEAGLGGGLFGYAYAVTNVFQVYTWGYNGAANLFRGDSTTPVTAPSNAYLGIYSKLFYFPRGDNLSSNGQLNVVAYTNGLIYVSGKAIGQTLIDHVAFPGFLYFVPTPRQFIDTTETISSIFVHGTATLQRWFILSNLGNLYSCGSNINSICTGGLASETAAANVNWCKISFSGL